MVYVPLKEVLPKGMDDKKARRILRDSGEFAQHDGHWEFPSKKAEKVHDYLTHHK